MVLRVGFSASKHVWKLVPPKAAPIGPLSVDSSCMTIWAPLEFPKLPVRSQSTFGLL
mgnify:CR=1 FL=1